MADPADAVAANQYAASLAEALSDAKVPLLAAVIVGMAPSAVADLLGAAAAEAAAAVVAVPFAISLAKPLNASTAAATLTAVVVRSAEPASAAYLAKPDTALAVAGPLLPTWHTLMLAAQSKHAGLPDYLQVHRKHGHLYFCYARFNSYQSMES
ncbi:TPA: hypothetical protein ACH3X2_001176 [Trebouxia sp. C0005]